MSGFEERTFDFKIGGCNADPCLGQKKTLLPSYLCWILSLTWFLVWLSVGKGRAAWRISTFCWQEEQAETHLSNQGFFAQCNSLTTKCLSPKRYPGIQIYIYQHKSIKGSKSQEIQTCSYILGSWFLPVSQVSPCLVPFSCIEKSISFPSTPSFSSAGHVKLLLELAVGWKCFAAL